MSKFDLLLNEEHCRTLDGKGMMAKPGTRLLEWFCFEPPIRVWPRNYLQECRIGAFSYLSPGCCLGKVEIGRYCSIGREVMTLSNHPTDWLTTSAVAYESVFSAPFRREDYTGNEYDDQSRTIRIGDDVWIGDGVRLKSGITIGDGAIVGAGALITKDVEPYTIVGGVPAKVIRPRFGKGLVEEIQRVRWTQYDISRISLPFQEPGAALKEISRLAGEGRLVSYAPKWVYINS